MGNIVRTRGASSHAGQGWRIRFIGIMNGSRSSLRAYGHVGQAEVPQGSYTHGHAIKEIAPRDTAMHSQLPVSLFFVHGLILSIQDS
jgi:hypothetical protein